MYKIHLLKPASQFYSNCQPSVVKKIDRAFSILKAEPHKHNNITKLTGDLSGLWRFRVGDYRIIYEIDEIYKFVKVILIEHRSKVYR